MAATVAAGGMGIGVPKLHPQKSSKPTSQFLGKKLRIKSNSPSQISTRITSSNPGRFRICALGGGELIDAVRELFLGVGVGLPCTVMECGDIIYRSTLPKSSGLTLTTPGAILALGALSYLWATPGVAPGFFDMFVLAFFERIFRPTFRKVCIILLFKKNFDFNRSFMWVLFYFIYVNMGFVWQDDFVLGKKLGEGAFGVVYRVSLAKKPASKV